MARYKGTFTVAANYEPLIAAPFDARSLVETRSDLINPTTWVRSDGGYWTYVGMVVSVSADIESSNNGLYILMDEDYTQLSNWYKCVDETHLGVVEGKVTALEGEDKKINETIGTIVSQITALQGEDDRLAELIFANTTEIGKKANAADVYTKTEADAAVKAITGEVATDTTLVAMIGAKANQATTYTKTEVDNLLANLEQTEISNAVAANTAAIAALAGEGNTSTVKKNADDIAALDATLKAALENDGEGLDSIKELAVWIQEHETEVLPVINAHSAILAGIGGEGEKATVKAYVDDAIAAIPTYELPAATADALGGVKSAADIDGKVIANAVYVDVTSNIGSVKAVSTDVLVQGVEEFILNGGSAKA